MKTCCCLVGEDLLLSFHTLGNTTTDLLRKVLLSCTDAETTPTVLPPQTTTLLSPSLQQNRQGLGCSTSTSKPHVNKLKLDRTMQILSLATQYLFKTKIGALVNKVATAIVTLTTLPHSALAGSQAKVYHGLSPSWGQVGKSQAVLVKCHRRIRTRAHRTACGVWRCP